MGLDARVYRGRIDLAGAEALSLRRDERTGEWFAAPPAPDLPREAVVAAEERIGNLAQVAWLRERIAASGLACPQLGELLACGSASGPVFSLSAAEAMAAEALALRRSLRRDRDMERFCAQIERLAAATQAEQNPIVLV